MNERLAAFALTGKAAIVTGGAGIVGSRICAGLAEAGAKVAVVDIDVEAANRVAAEINADAGEMAIGLGCDVTDPQAVSEMVDTVVERFGAVDLLMNNAAWKTTDLDRFFASFEEFDLETWRDVMSVNVDGMFLVAQAVGRQMKKQGGGAIVQTASIYGALAPDQRIYEGSEYNGRPINTPAVYTTSKAAVIGLTKHLATYWAQDNIRVNAIVLGGVASGQNEVFVQNYTARIPLGRMAETDDVVHAVIYLLSDAASYITGHSLSVEGGLSAW